MWRFHWHHHAVDARVNFGLTNPLLDFVFGTAVVPNEVELHTKLVPAWLREAGGSHAGIRAAR
jgi:sterol desaturase/sphingolipid hydroxylase (fatty acid hydroxylase superfamily)